MDKLKSDALKVWRKVLTVNRRIRGYYMFILQIVMWVLILYVLTPLLASFQPLFFATKTPLSISDFILLVTAAFVLAYTYQTQKLKEETIYQRRMSVAHDVRFEMTMHYAKVNEFDRVFGRLLTPEALNNVCELVFITAVAGSDIGKCTVFQKINAEDNFLKATYFIETQQGRDAFVQSLKLGGGEIRARVLVTNGEKFVYTFRAVTENWRQFLVDRNPNLNDEFILVKKEVDEN